MTSLPQDYRAVVWGAGGGIGQAFVEHLAADPRCVGVAAISRSARPDTAKVRALAYDPADPASIEHAAMQAADNAPIHLVVVAVGTLHTDQYSPEKALRQVNSDAFLEVMRINALLPTLIAQASVGPLAKERSLFAALSARVGSISDNSLGGWHAYRASKAALNMLLRNIAIEVGRRRNGTVIAGLHPGTVDTGLSAPFQGNVPEGKLFTPTYSAGQLLTVLNGLSVEQSGQCFDYAGKPIAF
ncbi:MAG: SDR family NAD(P)-dependent oxidoreductase [Parvularculaceae bacterium]|nr:SDR family NAD(P)-dependent oxidoreductase [Parvularculaceae bacterium]